MTNCLVNQPTHSDTRPSISRSLDRLILKIQGPPAESEAIPQKWWVSKLFLDPAEQYLAQWSTISFSWTADYIKLTCKGRFMRNMRSDSQTWLTYFSSPNLPSQFGRWGWRLETSDFREAQELAWTCWRAPCHSFTSEYHWWIPAA